MNALKTNKFRVGDEVKIVSLQGTDGIGYRGDCHVCVGETGVVTEVGVGDMPYAVETNDELWWWSENNLKLVNEETSTSQNESIKETNKLRVGDKVQVIKSNNTEEWFSVETQHILGEIVKVISNYSEPVYYVKVEGYTGIHNDGTFTFRNKHLKLVDQRKEESKPYNPLIAQEGGGHYKNRGIQPIEYSEANNLGACQHSVVKYITRHQDKNGIEDLSKIIHFTFLEAYFKYGEQGSTELKEKVLKLLGEHG